MVLLVPIHAIGRALFILLATSLLGGCTQLFFHPLKPHVVDPARHGIAVTDIYVDTPDGVRLHGWRLDAKAPAKGTVVFFHGNAENISTHLGNVWWLTDYGFNLVLVDYRGYGHSPGTPTLESVHIDTAAVLAHVFEMDRIDPEKIAVFGQSLGAAVATTVLAHSAYGRQVRALVLEGVFASYRRIAREKLGTFWVTWPLQVPLSLTVSDRYRPVDDIAHLDIPVLLVHGQADTIIGPHHAELLFAAAGEPKALWRVPGAGHIQVFTDPHYRQRLAHYLEDVMINGPATQPKADSLTTPH